MTSTDCSLGSNIYNEHPCEVGPGGSSVSLSGGDGITVVPDPITNVGTISLTNTNLETNTIFHSYNGVVSEPEIFVNPGTTNFQVFAGTLRFYDFTAVKGGGDPVETLVSWPTSGLIAGSLFDGVTTVTYLTINSTGTLIQRSREPTPLEAVNGEILIGNLDHQQPALLTFLQSTQTAHASWGMEAGLREFVRSRGGISISGNTWSPVALSVANQSTAGVGIRFGASHGVGNSPDLVSANAHNPIEVVQCYINNVGTFIVQAPVFTWNNNFYNNNGVLTSLPNNDFAIYRCFYAYGSDTAFMYYGTDSYNTINDALAAIPHEDFLEHPDSFVAAPVCVIIAREGAIDSSDTGDFRYIKLGGIRAGADIGAATPTVSLQNAYENGSKIVTNPINIAVKFQDTNPSSGDPILSVLDEVSDLIYTYSTVRAEMRRPLYLSRPTGQGGADLRFYEDPTNGSNFVGLAVPSAIASNSIYFLPTALGTPNQVLTTNGSASPQTLSWTTIGAVGGPVDPESFSYNMLAVTSLLNTVETIVVYDGILHDDNTNYNGSNTYTCPSNGLYTFNASCGFFSNPSGIESHMYFKVQGVNRAWSTSQPMIGTIALNITITMRMQTGWTVQVAVRQNSGANLNTTPDNRCVFAGFKVAD